MKIMTRAQITAACALLLATGVAPAQNVKVTPLGTHPGELCNRDRAMDSFGFSDGRARQCVILRSGMAFFESALDDLVDDDSVFGVHADETATLTGG